MLTEKDKIVTEEKEYTRIFNDHYINIVERSCRNKLTKLQKNKKLKTTKKQ